jgi:uncharacterized protein (TIGR00369 family)
VQLPVPHRRFAGRSGGLEGWLALRPLNQKTRDAVEDAVVGYQRYSGAQGGRRDPSIRVVVTLGQRVTDALTVCPEPSVDEDEIRTRMHGLRSTNSGFEFSHSLVSPPPSEGSIAQFGRGLKRDEGRSAHDDGLVPLRQGGSSDQTGSEHVGVDDYGTSGGLDAHPWSAARKAVPSSSSRSSITISSWGGNGRARRKSSSTGSSRDPDSGVTRSVDIANPDYPADTTASREQVVRGTTILPECPASRVPLSQVRTTEHGAAREDEYCHDPDGNRLSLSNLSPSPTSVLGGSDGDRLPFFEHLALRWTEMGAERVSVEIDIRDGLRGPAGTLQGGVIATLVDVAATTAAQGSAGLVATSEMTVHFLAPGRIGPIRAVGELLRSRSGGAAVEVRVYDSGNQDRLMVVALAAFSDLSGSARASSSARTTKTQSTPR